MNRYLLLCMFFFSMNSLVILPSAGKASDELAHINEGDCKKSKENNVPAIKLSGIQRKKKVIIFSSKGGGGHESVAQALKSYFDDEFTIEITNIYSEVVGQYDPLRALSCGLTSGEKLYNALISRNFYKTISCFVNCANLYHRLLISRLTQKIKLFLEEEKPDLVISVVPLINNAALNACQQLNLPFLLIPTDLDIKLFISDIQKTQYKKFKILLPFKDEKTKSAMAQAHVPSKQAKITGFAIRSDFFAKKDAQSIKDHYQIPSNKPVILLMLGAHGSDSVIKFARELVKVKNPFHLIVCLGRRSDLAIKLRNIQFPSHISQTILGFTPNISDLMAISDLCITKSGSVSFCETLHMNLPMILDATILPLPWEQANHEFVMQHKCGRVLKKYENLPDIVDSLLNHPEKIAQFKKRLAEIPKKNPANEMHQLINQFLKQ